MKHFTFIFFFLLLLSCSDDDGYNDNNGNEDPINPPNETYTIWEGENITFTKEAETDPNLPENQDAITASVAITRGNEGGQIYNILQEDSANQDVSPVGTKWAIGVASNIANLTFSDFRSAVGKPIDVVGKNLILYIEAEEVYISVKFLSWGQGKNGAFSYERSTEE